MIVASVVLVLSVVLIWWKCRRQSKIKHQNGYVAEKIDEFDDSLLSSEQPRLKRKVGAWLQHHEHRMLDPMLARASRVSAASYTAASSSIALGDAIDERINGAFIVPQLPSCRVAAVPNPLAGLFIPKSKPSNLTPTPTEIINRTYSSWNTWGVIQHRDSKDKGFKQNKWHQ
jgi:hypothetical protein